jgi:hypothetical protein
LLEQNEPFVNGSTHFSGLPQAIMPCGQFVEATQVPAVQMSPVAQVMPQPPPLEGSVRVTAQVKTPAEETQSVVLSPQGLGDSGGVGSAPWQGLFDQ